MSKDQVLELYLNRIFFGDNAYGIDAAAQIYFGKPAAQLDLQEAALLAALPKAPTRLALTNDMPAALRRSRLVLENMRIEGWISPRDEEAALAAPPKLAPEAPGEGDYGYVLDMAAAQAVQISGGQAPSRWCATPSLRTAAARGSARAPWSYSRPTAPSALWSVGPTTAIPPSTARPRPSASPVRPSSPSSTPPPWSRG
jgi:hypothetical protein